MKGKYVGLFLILTAVGGYLAWRGQPSISPHELLARGSVAINGESYNVEVARSQQELTQGLSGRSRLERGHGMLFVFPRVGAYAFWMKDTLIPLDIIWINNDRIVDIKPDAQPSTSADPPAFFPKQPANYVLEISGGDAESFDFKIGNPVRIRIAN